MRGSRTEDVVIWRLCRCFCCFSCAPAHILFIALHVANRLCAPTADEPTSPAPEDANAVNEQPRKESSSLSSMLKNIVEDGVETVVKGLRKATEGSFVDVYQTLDGRNENDAPPG